MSKFRIKDRLKSFKYAAWGVKFVAKTQHNFWIHLAIMIAVIVCGILFNVSYTEWLLLILCIGFVLVAEIMNTAFEELIDFISPEYSKKAGIIKDIGAGAVLVASIISAIVGLLIFIPKIL